MTASDWPRRWPTVRSSACSLSCCSFGASVPTYPALNNWATGCWPDSRKPHQREQPSVQIVEENVFEEIGAGALPCCPSESYSLCGALQEPS